MALMRWEPTRELQSLQHEVNRLFGTFFDMPAGAGESGKRLWMPAMDLVETAETYILRADLPGLSEQDVKVELEDNVLTISGEREAEHDDSAEGYHRIERASGTFSRSLTLPEGVDSDQIDARFERGVLEVRIPKPEQRKRQRVAIAVGDQPRTIDSSETQDEPSETQGRPVTT